jgi:hypothetical protein
MNMRFAVPYEGLEHKNRGQHAVSDASRMRKKEASWVGDYLVFPHPAREIAAEYAVTLK